MPKYSTGKISKENIYKTSKKLFYEKGFVNATLSAIAAASNTNSAMVAYYFKNKTNLGLQVLDEYVTASSVWTHYFLKKYFDGRIPPFIEVSVGTRVLNRNYSQNQNLLRFYLELNATNFYLSKDSGTVSFFENLNRYYHCGFDRNQVRGASISNYALANALMVSKANGFIDCTNEYIIDMILKHTGQCFNLEDDYVEACIEDSLKLSEKIPIYVGTDFTVFH